MERAQIIDILRKHIRAVGAETNVENLADHLLAVIHEHYETLESKLRVNELTLSAFGINRD